MTNKEITERADDYFALANFKPWQRLVAEMEELANDLTTTVMLSDDACLNTKGKVQGIRMVIETPLIAVKDYMTNREQPSKPDGQDPTGEQDVESRD